MNDISEFNNSDKAICVFDMAEIVIKGLSWFLVIAMYVVAYAMPCLYVYHTGRLGRGVLYSWLAQIGFMILMSQVVFELLIHIFPDHLELICKSFPEGNSIVAAFCSGWIFALIICGIAKLIYKGRNKSAGWKFPRSESKGSDRGG